MSYERFIARRLRLSGSRRGASRNVIIAISGIALSMVVMMIALCVVLGFKEQIRARITGFDGHVSIYAADDDYAVTDPLLDFSGKLKEVVDSKDGFTSASIVLQQPGILKTDSAFQAIVFKGVGDGNAWRIVADNIVDGELPDYTDPDNRNRVNISRVIARMLKLNVGDKVNAYFFIGDAVKARRIEVASIFDTNFTDYDRMYVYTPLQFTQGLLGVDGNTGNKVELTVGNIDGINDAAIHLHSDMMTAAYSGELPGSYRIGTVLESGMMYFNWLELLDTNVVVILILMMLVSGFTLVSSLFIIILERVNTIGILKALGACNRSLRHIFVLLGCRVIMWGMIIGDLVGISVMLLQYHTHWLPLDPEAYYLDYVPVTINWWYLGALNAGVFLIAWSILLIPSSMVARISPAVTVRYE